MNSLNHDVIKHKLGLLNLAAEFADGNGAKAKPVDVAIIGQELALAKLGRR